MAVCPFFNIPSGMDCSAKGTAPPRLCVMARYEAILRVATYSIANCEACIFYVFFKKNKKSGWFHFFYNFTPQTNTLSHTK